MRKAPYTRAAAAYATAAAAADAAADAADAVADAKANTGPGLRVQRQHLEVLPGCGQQRDGHQRNVQHQVRRDTGAHAAAAVLRVQRDELAVLCESGRQPGE